MNTQSSGKKVSFSKVKAVSVTPDRFAKGKFSLRLSQVKTTEYSSQSRMVGFSNIPVSGNSYDSERNYWVNGLDFATVQEAKEYAQKFMKEYPEMHIQQLSSHKVILLDSHKAAINAGLTTVEEISNSQLVKNKAGEVVETAEGENWYTLNILHSQFIEDQVVGEEISAFVEEEKPQPAFNEEYDI